MSATDASVDRLNAAATPTVYCVRCGYDLRGLPGDRACPECGTPIALSLARQGFAGSDPQWLRRVGRGAVLLHNGLLLVLAFVALMVVISIVMRLSAGTWQLPIAVLVVTLTALGLPMLVGTGMTLVGAWLVSSPGVREQETALERAATWGVRGGLVAVIAGAVVAIAYPIMSPAWCLVLGATVHALSWRLATLAQRASRRRTGVAPRHLRLWSGGLVLALFMLAVIATITMLQAFKPGTTSMLKLLLVPTVWASIIGGIATLMLLVRSVAGLRDELEVIVRAGI